MNSAAYASIILGCCVLWVACSFPVALSCDSCGRECASACGTRHFRTCCFNYLRKRSSSPPIAGPAGPDRHLEFWYAAKAAAQSSRENRLGRRLGELMMSNAENDLDYEYVPIASTNHLTLGALQTPTRSGTGVGDPPVHSSESDDGRSAERSNEKTSEEMESGRLQLLYES
uniref:Trissin n=1 Tax=Anopheles atroparvus TaxID=41427 RepID=A0AAG5D2D3_ANOAO